MPVALAAQGLIVYSPAAVEAVRGFLDQRETLTLPAFVSELPLVGSWLDQYWQVLMQSQAELVALARHFAEPAKALLVAVGGAIGAGLVQVLIAIFVAFFLYRDGERVQRLLMGGMERLAGREHGGALAATAQAAVKGVVYGLLGTALVQAIVAAIGFLIAGVPGAAVLGALTFVLSLIPMGPVLAWGGAAIWLYAQGHSGWAIFMVVYGVARDQLGRQLREADPHEPRGQPLDAARGPRRLRRCGRIRLHRALRGPRAPRRRVEPHQGVARPAPAARGMIAFFPFIPV